MGGAASSESQSQIVATGYTEEPVSDTKEKSRKSEAEAVKENHRKKPHNCDAIIREADIFEDNQHDLYSGIFLKNRSKKYWVDVESGCNCFAIYARGLSITWSEDPQYWHWFQMKETSEVNIEVASLLNVCWLEVHGTFKKAYLTPNSAYEIVFVMMLKDPAYGWEVPVNLRLVSSENSSQEHKEFLLEKPRGRWIELAVGHFVVSTSDAALTDEIEFSIFEYEGGLWKRGLVVKGAIIRPKK